MNVSDSCPYIRRINAFFRAFNASKRRSANSAWDCLQLPAVEPQGFLLRGFPTSNLSLTAPRVTGSLVVFANISFHPDISSSGVSQLLQK